MKCLILAVVLVVCVAHGTKPKWHELEKYTFEQYHTDFRKQYPKHGNEYAMREAIFERKVADIKEHNADLRNSWKRGVNQFTDMTATEWKNYNRASATPEEVVFDEVFQGSPATPLPLTVDYRQWNDPRVLTAVKHQGACGSCWAFSAVESIEAYYALRTGMLPVLSAQQVNSCATSNGCDGFFAVGGFEYVKNLTQSTGRGLTEEWCYPYENFFLNSMTPTTKACKNIAKEYPAVPYKWFAELTEAGVTGFGRPEKNDAVATMRALAQLGPLSISVAAGNWQDYESGIFQNTAKYGVQNEWGVDHDVQMVGYGSDKMLGMNYWIVRNSWGTLWGDNGYIRLDRPAVEPCYPNATVPYVCGTSACLNGPSYPIVVENKPVHY